MGEAGGLRPGWSEHRSRKNPGEVYYFNSRTGASTYSRAEATEAAPAVVSLAVTREEVVLLAKEVVEGGDKVSFQVTIEGETAEETAFKFKSILKASRAPLKDAQEIKLTKTEKFDEPELQPEVKIMESRGEKAGSLEASEKCNDIKRTKTNTKVKGVERIKEREVSEQNILGDSGVGKRTRRNFAESVDALEEKILMEHPPVQDSRRDVGRKRKARARPREDRKLCRSSRSRSGSRSSRKYAKEGLDYGQELLCITGGGPGPKYEVLRAGDGRYTVSVAACGHTALGTHAQRAQAMQAAARNLIDKLRRTKMEVEEHRRKGKSGENCSKSSSPPRKSRERRSNIWCWHQGNCRNRNCKFQHGEDFDFSHRMKEEERSRGHLGADCDQ